MTEEKTKNPNPGLAKRLRAWMSAQEKPFTLARLYEELNIPPGRPRVMALHVVQEAVRRKELFRVKQNLRQNLPGRKPEGWDDPKNQIVLYTYNHSWKPTWRAPLRERIFKAMRLISFHEPFATSDVMRIADISCRSYVDQLKRRLLSQGNIECVGERVRSDGSGFEKLYRVKDPSRFRLEVME